MSMVSCSGIRGIVRPSTTGPPASFQPGVSTWTGSGKPGTNAVRVAWAGSRFLNSASVQGSRISPVVASTTSSGTSRASPSRPSGSTTRWVAVRATGSTTTDLTSPRNPSLQRASLPITSVINSRPPCVSQDGPLSVQAFLPFRGATRVTRMSEDDRPLLTVTRSGSFDSSTRKLLLPQLRSRNRPHYGANDTAQRSSLRDLARAPPVLNRVLWSSCNPPRRGDPGGTRPAHRARPAWLRHGLGHDGLLCPSPGPVRPGRAGERRRRLPPPTRHPGFPPPVLG